MVQFSTWPAKGGHKDHSSITQKKELMYDTNLLEVIIRLLMHDSVQTKLEM